MNPHIGSVGGGDAVAEPLMRALVDDDEVESEADAGARPVAPQVAVGEVVAVGHRALVLHAGVGHLDQLVSIFRKRIVAEIVPKDLQHAFGLGKLLFRLRLVFRQHVKIERQIAQPVGEVHVVADVQRDVVVVDGIVNQPIPARVAIAQVGLAHEFSVGDIDQAVGNRHADFHALHFIAPLVLVRPPDAGAGLFARGVDPGMAGRVFAEGDSAKAAGLDGMARIVEVDGVLAPCSQRLRKVDEDRSGIALVLEFERHPKRILSTCSAGCRSSWIRVPSWSILKRMVFLP